tara:strand:- start:401 stop:676 length:276 start_codon:yes stop_codon:yes gene_type:complete
MKWFEKLSNIDQEIIRKSYPSKGIGRKMIKDEWRYDLENASTIGFNIHKLTYDQKMAWRKALQPAIDKIVSLSGPRGKEIYKKVKLNRDMK